VKVETDIITSILASPIISSIIVTKLIPTISLGDNNGEMSNLPINHTHKLCLHIYITIDKYVDLTIYNKNTQFDTSIKKKKKDSK
jgi:hypothetical protein